MEKINQNNMTAVEWFAMITGGWKYASKEQLEQAKKMQKEQMIEFAKLHVEAALKSASEKAKIDKSVTFGWEKVDRPSILKSYPLENIK
jgi:hypothetical protein